MARGIAVRSTLGEPDAARAPERRAAAVEMRRIAADAALALPGPGEPPPVSFPAAGETCPFLRTGSGLTDGGGRRFPAAGFVGLVSAGERSQAWAAAPDGRPGPPAASSARGGAGKGPAVSARPPPPREPELRAAGGTGHPAR